jgi:L-proline amide hydrolase
VVICHGGPGATHDYVAPIAEQLHRSGRACVLYDQLGNGRSDHLPDVDPSFWTVELFERELAALADHLGIEGRYHVVGQSWGGILALLHALERPPGLLSVVAADSPASIPAFVAAATSCSTRWSRRCATRSVPASAAARPPRRSSRRR